MQMDGGLQRATGVNHSLLIVFCGIVPTTHMHIGSCSPDAVNERAAG